MSSAAVETTEAVWASKAVLTTLAAVANTEVVLASKAVLTILAGVANSAVAAVVATEAVLAVLVS